MGEYKHFRKIEEIEKDVIENFYKMKNEVENIDGYRAFLKVTGGDRYYRMMGVSKTANGIVLELLDGNNNWEYTRNLSRVSEFDPNEWKVVLRTSRYTESNKSKKLPRYWKEPLLEYQEYTRYMKDPNRLQKEEEYRNSLRLYDVDENGDQVSIEQWRELAEIADDGSTREHGESRAVVIDNVLCCSAAAAIRQLPEYERYLESDRQLRKPEKDGDILYKRCAKGGTYTDDDGGVHSVHFATKEEINAKIEKLSESDN